MRLKTTHQSKLNLRVGGLLALAFLLPSLPLSGEVESSLLSMRVAPMVCSAPCDLVVTLRVPPSAENEMVELSLEPKEEPSKEEETDYGRLSELPLDEHSPKTFQVRYPMVPKGAYSLSATLWRHDGVSWIAAKATSSILVR